MKKHKQKSNRPTRLIQKHHISKVTKTLLLYALLALSSLIYTATVLKRKEFGDSQINEVIFYIFNGFTNGNSADTLAMIYDNLMLFFIVLFLLLLPVVDFYRNKILLNFNLSLFGKNKTITFNPSKIAWWVKYTYAGIVLLFAVGFLLVSFKVPAYISGLLDTGQLFEKHYVDPKNVELEFPKQPRNLVFIYLESMENTLASRTAGGQMDSSLIPELEKIALDDKTVSFSHQQTGLGGAQPVLGTTWTVASMISHSLGVPIKSNFTGLGGNDYGKLNKFFPGTYGIGDVLHEAGYNQSFVMGSDQSFGGRNKLLEQHGQYKVLDHMYAKKHSRIPDDYHVWWGHEDKKMLDFAKEEALRLSEQSKPFNLQLLTVDTHFVDGYLDPSCPTPYQRQYDNVFACSSARIGEFVAWLQQQSFADETTIVIVGDHLGMQQAYYDDIVSNPHYQRTTYNAIINPATAVDKKAPRQFAAFDMYPTTLAALGVKIPGERLGLGTNLFAADTQTLLERYGSVEALNLELAKRSNLYERKLLIGR